MASLLTVQVQGIALEDTKTCQICSKPIELAKFRLHDAQCTRNNYKCEMCNEAVPKTDRSKHEEEVHTTLPCKHC